MKAAGSKKTILVVDNDPVILKLMSEFLRRQGHQVHCAQDGFGCFDILATITPDIIFLDLVMPRIPGHDLCRAIRSMDMLMDCYIVIVSGIVVEEQADYRAIGADACIAKGPFKEMSTHIRQVIADSDRPREKGLAVPVLGSENLYVRRITQELVKQNQHQKTILECLSQGIIEIYLARVVYCNPKALEILETRTELLVGQHIETCLPYKLLNMLNKNGSNYNRKSGEVPSLIEIGKRQVIVEAISLNGNEMDRIILLSDVTENKRLETVIAATNLSKNISYIFSGIRHEIGNPVNSIKMALHVLQRNLEVWDIKTVSEFLDRSLLEVERIEYLLKALKNYSLFETPTMESVALVSFIQNFITLIENDFGKKKIHIDIRDYDSNLTAWTDPRALHHILLNIFTNAADALEGHDHPEIIVTTRKKRDRIVVEIQDNGKGMTNHEKSMLFKPFFTSKTRGTGLGLMIVQKMLIAMNGTIDIDSSKDVGTTVTISLPEATYEEKENLIDY